MTGPRTDAPRVPQPRECYQDVTRYTAESGAARIDLSDNTNLWGAPPAVLPAMQSFSEGSIARYPESYSGSLRKTIAGYAGIESEMIVTGCGSDDIIDSAMRAFAEPGDKVCFADPTFSMVPVFARASGLVPVAIGFEKDFDLSPQRVAGEAARIIYLCSPNNPTGTILSPETVKRIVADATGLVIIDEAYIEFGGESAIELVSSGRVLITRTLSKAFGLAGLRIGYGIASPEIVAAVEKARGPYKVNAVAEVCAAVALNEGDGWVSDRIAEVKVNRERFSEELRALGYSPIASSANFVLVPVRSCEDAAARLAGRGIAVRALPALGGIGDALRISVGPWAMMQECLDALGSSR